MVHYITLKCPTCNENFLHQRESTTIWRYHEDGDGLSTKTSPNSVNTKQELNDNIRGRRDSIEIMFECEYCEKKNTFVIAQHKGETMLFWDNIGPPSFVNSWRS